MTEKRIPVLLVDDDEDDFVVARDLLAEITEPRYEVQWISQTKEALEVMISQRHEVCLVDYRLGEQTGLDLLRQAVHAGIKAPIILLTGQGEHDVDLEAMRLGASDYLVKGQITAPLLDRSIRYAIERKRLEGAMRQSEKLSAVGQLAAGVAHEINNPLGVILGFSQALQRYATPGSVLELPLKSIERETLRCRNLVQDLLTFSRVATWQLGPLDLNKVVEEAILLVAPQAKLKHISVQKELTAALPSFQGNGNQIQQIAINLANNAMDAMGEGGALTFKTQVLMEESHQWICLQIMDTGPGIPPNVLHRIFEPFFTTKPIGQGTGLGLSLVHEIVKKHSGTIDVQSRPGMTEFRLTFPPMAQEEQLQKAAPHLPQNYFRPTLVA